MAGPISTEGYFPHLQEHLHVPDTEEVFSLNHWDELAVR